MANPHTPWIPCSRTSRSIRQGSLNPFLPRYPSWHLPRSSADPPLRNGPQKAHNLCAFCGVRLLCCGRVVSFVAQTYWMRVAAVACPAGYLLFADWKDPCPGKIRIDLPRSEEHTSELQSRLHLV